MITILDARESGFSPFDGINIAIKPVGGTAIIKPSNEMIEKIKDKPTITSGETPKDGWEIIDITGFKPAIAEKIIDTTKGKYLVKIIAEPSMASRNLKYKSEIDEPIYFLVWASKFSWKSMAKS
jgi:hypothetical protein